MVADQGRMKFTPPFAFGLQIIRDWVLRLQRPRTRTGWSMGSHRAHLRSSTPITAAHWRKLLRPARSRRYTATCLAAHRT